MRKSTNAFYFLFGILFGILLINFLPVKLKPNKVIHCNNKYYDIQRIEDSESHEYGIVVLYVKDNKRW